MTASLEIDILYADNKIVVINKPSGLLTIPGRGPENQDSAATRIQAMFPECTKFPTVHRLDMDTSGVLVFGLTKRAQRELSQQFHDRETSKRYIALLDGRVTKPEGRIDLPLKMDMFNRPYQMFDPVHGREAVTLWRRLAEEGDRTRVEFTPLTGRTHQLRMHASHPLGLGCPIVGDRLYGTGTGPGQLCLHAEYLAFDHPKTKERMEFTTSPRF